MAKTKKERNGKIEALHGDGEQMTEKLANCKKEIQILNVKKY